MASEAKAKRPRKKISSARSMPLVYDAQYLKHHGGKGSYQHTPGYGQRQPTNQALRLIGDYLQNKGHQQRSR